LGVSEVPWVCGPPGIFFVASGAPHALGHWRSAVVQGSLTLGANPRHVK
jgi:hypothetical protein